MDHRDDAEGDAGGAVDAVDRAPLLVAQLGDLVRFTAQS